MTTEEGLPLDYKLFPGNTYEGKTLIESVDSLSKSYDISKTFVVADRGMCREENLKELEKRGISFIIATKLRTMNREAKERILQDIGLGRERTKEDYFTREYPHEKGRLIVSYSKKRGKKSKHDRDRIVNQLKRKMKDGEIKVTDLIKNSGTKKYLKLPNKKSPCGTLDKGKIAEDERWDGIYGVITNCKSKSNLNSHDQILSRHRKLWQIENAFRVNKHDMKMRPIYHWTPKRIKAHILICFMAYSVITRVKYKLQREGVALSIAKIKEELSYVQESIVRDTSSGKRFILPSSPTELQRKIYQALGKKLNTRPRMLG